MGNHLDISTNAHIYKPKRWTLALNIFSLGFMGIVFGVPLILLIILLVSFIQAESMIYFACFLSPIIILLIFVLIQTSISVIASFFYSIEITPEGIEQKHSPYMHIRCTWSDVDKLGKLFLFNDVIHLNSYEVMGLSLSLKSPFSFLRPKKGFISLLGYEGWPDGQLANELKQYAPKLFENQPILQETRLENQGAQTQAAPGATQESHLLAALSHASVLFSYIGVVVPIVIFLAQKKKSSFIGFQSLQALIWQIVAIAFKMIASSCMVGTLFIPILLASLSNDGKILGLSTGGILILIIAPTLMMILGSLFFTIYGIIGAIQAYQGKEFRYVIIANQIAKQEEP
jgi:uncharacterized Tic20 family protein